MMTDPQQPSLFDNLAFLPVKPPLTEPEPKLSPGRRRTLRQAALIDRGLHPLAKTPLLEPAGHTCGECVHRIRRSGYPKCDEWSGIYLTGSEGTDVRARWPACRRYQERPHD